MKLGSIKTIEEFESLANAWNAILGNSASHVPFLRHEYLATWWRTLGGGEWQRGDLFIVTGEDEVGELCGIAPLFYTHNREGEAALMLLGSIEISDFLDVIAREDCLGSFLDGLLGFLDTSHAPPWQVIDLYNILDDSPNVAGISTRNVCNIVHTSPCLVIGKHILQVSIKSNDMKYGARYGVLRRVKSSLAGILLRMKNTWTPRSKISFI